MRKIFGTRDGIASYDKMLRNKHLLPPAKEWVAIEGGNHVQFRSYRHQLADDSADISRSEPKGAVEKGL